MASIPRTLLLIRTIGCIYRKGLNKTTTKIRTVRAIREMHKCQTYDVAVHRRCSA